MLRGNDCFFLVTKRDECKKIVNPKLCSTDLHYNQTFIATAAQTNVTSVLQKIVNSRCSPEFEKYLCYASAPPCMPNDLSVYVPCRDVCEQVFESSKLLFYSNTCVKHLLILSSSHYS